MLPRRILFHPDHIRALVLSAVEVYPKETIGTFFFELNRNTVCITNISPAQEVDARTIEMVTMVESRAEIQPWFEALTTNVRTSEYHSHTEGDTDIGLSVTDIKESRDNLEKSDMKYQIEILIHIYPKKYKKNHKASFGLSKNNKTSVTYLLKNGRRGYHATIKPYLITDSHVETMRVEIE